MPAHDNDLVSMTLALVIAAASAATLFFMDFSPKDDAEHHGVSMITAAVVERAGATALPTEPPAARKPPLF
jgi:hypothetical protein